VTALKFVFDLDRIDSQLGSLQSSPHPLVMEPCSIETSERIDHRSASGGTNMRHSKRAVHKSRVASIVACAILTSGGITFLSTAAPRSVSAAADQMEFSGSFSPFPGVASDGRGTVTVSLNRQSQQLIVSADITSLTSGVSRAGIRTAGAGSLDFVAVSGPNKSATIRQTVTISDAMISALVNDQMLIRVSTLSNPRGELDAPLVATPNVTTSIAATTPTVVNTTIAPATTSPVTTAPATTAPATTAAPTTVPVTSPPQPGTQAPPSGARLSRSYGIWTPSIYDSCSKTIHDKYWTYGPDGKVYPTWHPPVDPATGCTFGHEHGANPALSKIKNVSLPFGYTNEQLNESDIGFERPEDHVGQKVEIANDVPMALDQFGPVVNRCNFMFKLHMGSHSGDAFNHNLHEVFNYISCDDGTELRMQTLNGFGVPGELTAGCDLKTVIPNGTPEGVADAGTRDIPTRQCMEQVLVPEGQTSSWGGGGGAGFERWVMFYSRDNAAPGFGRVFSQVYLNVENSSRYFDAAAPNNLARQVDLCYVTGARQVRNDEYCDRMRTAFPGQRIAFDDPRSPFNGGKRFLTTAQLVVQNKSATTDWYTDVFGNNYSSTPFPGAVKQYISRTNTVQDTKFGFVSYPADHSKEPGIHAPN
jgi:CHRD domain